jgi:hypothetical protein
VNGEGLNEFVEYEKRKLDFEKFIPLENDSDELNDTAFNNFMAQLIENNSNRLTWVRMEKIENNNIIVGISLRGRGVRRNFFSLFSFAYLIKSLANEIEPNFDIMNITTNDIYKSSCSTDIQEAIKKMINFRYPINTSVLSKSFEIKIYKTMEKIKFECELKKDKGKERIITNLISLVPNEFFIFLNDNNVKNYPQYTNFNCLEVFLVFFMNINKKFKERFKLLYQNNHSKKYSPMRVYYYLLEEKIEVEKTEDLKNIPPDSLIRDEDQRHYIYKFKEDKYASLWTHEKLKIQILKEDEAENLFLNNIFGINGKNKYHHYKAIDMMKFLIENEDLLSEKADQKFGY